MSVSRAELEAMDRDELIETVIKMDRDVQRLDALVSALQTQHQQTKAEVFGERVNDDLQIADVTTDESVLARLDDLTERVAELEGQVAPDPERKSYDEMERSEKVQQVRISIAREAKDTARGTATMNYREVKSLFNSHPSTGYAYTLMELAGNADGFEYQQRDGHENRLVVSIGSVNDEAVLHAVNNDMDSGGV